MSAMTTETFGGGHGAPSTVAFYAPGQKRNVLGEFDKEDGSGETTDWEKAKSMSVGQWDAMSDKERASLLAAVYVADADKKPGASAALAKLRGWVAGGKDRKSAGKKAAGAAKGAADKKKRETESAKKKADADKARAERARNARRVRPDAVNSGHADGYIIGESENKSTRMRWDREHSTYVVEKKDGGKWKESRRLKPDQAYDELAKANADWFRPAMQPYLKPAAKKPAAKKTSTKTPVKSGPGVNEGAVTAAAEVHTGAMIALIPREDLTASLAVDGGEDAEQLHMTEVYLGQVADIPDDEQFRIIDVMSDFAARQPPVEGDAFSVNLFNPAGATQSDGKDRDSCVTLGISGHDIAAFHDELVDALERAGIEFPEQHEPRIPHVTLVYTDDADLSYFTDKTGPIVFDTLRVAFGGEVFDIPLGEGRDDDLTAGGVAFYSPTQKRDGDGQWTDGPAGAVKDLAELTSSNVWDSLSDHKDKVIGEGRMGDNLMSRFIAREDENGPYVESQWKNPGGWSKLTDIRTEQALQQAMNGYPKAQVVSRPTEEVDAPAAKSVPKAEPVSDYAPAVPEKELPKGWVTGASVYSPDRAQDVHDAQMEKTPWDGDQEVIIDDYTQTYFDPLNTALRADEDVVVIPESGPVKVSETTDVLDSMMYKLPKMSLFRQTNPDAFGAKSVEELKDLVGSEFFDKAYMSTSVKPNQAVAGMGKMPVHIRIEAPRGTRGAYIGGISDLEDEAELLLGRGTRFMITSVVIKNGRAFMKMKVMNNG